MWVFIGSFSFAQGEEMEQLFEEAIDYINCAFAKQSLRDQPDKVLLSKFYHRFPTCGTTENTDRTTDFFTDLMKFFQNNNLKSNQRLATSINNYKRTFDDEFGEELAAGDVVDTEDIVSLIDKIFQLPDIRKFNQNHPNTFGHLQREIQQGVSKILAGSKNDVEPVVRDYTNDETMDETTTAPESSRPIYPSSDFSNDYNERLFFRVVQNSAISRKSLLGLFVLIVFGLVGFFVIKNLSPQYPNNTSYPDLEIDHKATNKMMEKLMEEVKTLKKQNVNLKEEIEVLRFRVKDLQKKKETLPPPPPIPTTLKELVTSKPKPKPPAPSAPILKNFFMPIPSSTGIFSARDSHPNFKRRTSVYKFHIISDDGTQAEFEIHHDIATMIRALDEADTYLKPVCRSSSILPISATKIITVEKGIANLEYNEWKVIKKAVIRYQ